jgi:hypothetical protein
MEPRSAATRVPDPDAAEFIRFCYRRRRVGWPELYDEMCAVAARGLFRGLGADELAAHGIAFGLFDMPALAAMSSGIVAEEQALRRPMAVVIAPEILSAVEGSAPIARDPIPTGSSEDVVPAVAATPVSDPADGTSRVVRFLPVPAGA